MSNIGLLKELHNAVRAANSTALFSTELLKPRVIPKGRILIEIGDVSEKLYLIQKGVMRAYYLRGGEDVTSWLVSDGEIACLSESFLREIPSGLALETLEDSLVYTVRYGEYRRLIQQDPLLAGMAISLLEDHLINTSNRVHLFRYLSVEERISHYLSLPTSLFRRIPDRYIATYLGTTESTFCRSLKNIHGYRQ